MMNKITWGLWASKGDEMVKLAAASRLRTYTNFAFSMAEITTLHPLGSMVRYWPCTIHRAPDLPNVAWCNLTKLVVFES